MLKALKTLLKEDIINQKHICEDVLMSKLQLTTEEFELLLIINEIMEFNKQKSENIPEGGIGEIIVSSNIMDNDSFMKIANNLYDKGLLNDDWFMTESGEMYIKQFNEDIENKKKDKTAVCKNDYSKIDFNLIYINVNGASKKDDWGKVFDRVCKVIEIVLTIIAIIYT